MWKWRIFTGNCPAKVFVTVMILTGGMYMLKMFRPRISYMMSSGDEELSEAMIRARVEKIIARLHNRSLLNHNESKRQKLNHLYFENGKRVEAAENTTQTPQFESTDSYVTGTEIMSDTTEYPTETTTGYTLVYEESTKSEDGYRHVDGIGGDEKYTTASSIEFNSRDEFEKIERIIEQARKTDTRPSAKKRIRILKPDEIAKATLRDTVELTFKERRKTLRNHCGPRKGWIWLDKMQTLTVPERNLTVCVVQKAGSTSWHKLVYSIRFPGRPWDTAYRADNWDLAWRLPKSRRQQLMKSKSAIRVITVRHPFARLVSGWHNKFHRAFVERNDNVMKKSMPGLDKYIGLHPPDKDHIIAFRDLVQYLADVGLEKMDVHFRSIEQLCSPCLFPYDYIIKSETAPEDSWFVTDKINVTMADFGKHIPDVDKDPASRDSEGFQTAAELRQAAEARAISGLFRTVPRATIRVLLALYKEDFDAFGYTFDVSTLEVGGYT